MVSMSASLFFFAETASPLVSNPLPLLQSKCDGRPHCRVQGGARTQLLLNRPFPIQYPPEPLANSGHFSLSYWFSSNVFLASATLTDQSSLGVSNVHPAPLCSATGFQVRPLPSRSEAVDSGQQWGRLPRGCVAPCGLRLNGASLSPASFGGSRASWQEVLGQRVRSVVWIRC